jgi:hypothetical protein
MTAQSKLIRRFRLHRLALLLLPLFLFLDTMGYAQTWFPQPWELFTSPGYGYIRYADRLLSMGDINRDGIPDLLINVLDRKDSTLLPHTYGLFGKRPGIIETHRWLDIDGSGTLAKGDVNGDGLMDLVAQRYSESACVFLGHTTGPYIIDTVPAWILRPEPVDERPMTYFGEHIAIGDLNGDGIDDIAIAAPSWVKLGDDGRGKVYIYFGGSKTPTIPDVTGNYPVRNNYFGANGLWIEDVNGDGQKDLIVCNDVPSWSIYAAYGYVDVYLGGPAFTIDPWHPDQRLGPDKIPSLAEAGSFGREVSILDVNSDGINDLAVFDYFNGYFFHGGPGGFHVPADYIMRSPDTTRYIFARRAYKIGDINGDGFDDFAIQAEKSTSGAGLIGQLFLYLGGPEGIVSYPSAVVWSPSGGRMVGDHLARLGDIDGDGFNDFAVDWSNESGPGFMILGGYPWERTTIESFPLPEAPTITMYPNPFIASAMVTFAVDGTDADDLLIYDAFGREIRSISGASRTRDGIVFSWNGRDERGSPVPGGVYYAIAKTKNGFAKGRMVKLE